MAKFFSADSWLEDLKDIASLDTKYGFIGIHKEKPTVELDVNGYIKSQTLISSNITVNLLKASNLEASNLAANFGDLFVAEINDLTVSSSVGCNALINDLNVGSNLRIGGYSLYDECPLDIEDFRFYFQDETGYIHSSWLRSEANWMKDLSKLVKDGIDLGLLLKAVYDWFFPPSPFETLNGAGLALQKAIQDALQNAQDGVENGSNRRLYVDWENIKKRPIAHDRTTKDIGIKGNLLVNNLTKLKVAHSWSTDGNGNLNMGVVGNNATIIDFTTLEGFLNKLTISNNIISTSNAIIPNLTSSNLFTVNVTGRDFSTCNLFAPYIGGSNIYSQNIWTETVSASNISLSNLNVNTINSNAIVFGSNWSGFSNMILCDKITNYSQSNSGKASLELNQFVSTIHCENSYSRSNVNWKGALFSVNPDGMNFTKITQIYTFGATESYDGSNLFDLDNLGNITFGGELRRNADEAFTFRHYSLTSGFTSNGVLTMDSNAFMYLIRTNVYGASNYNVDNILWSVNSNGMFLQTPQQKIMGKVEGAYSNFPRIEFDLQSGFIFGSGISNNSIANFDYFKVSREGEIYTLNEDGLAMMKIIDKKCNILRGGLVLSNDGSIWHNNSNLWDTDGNLVRKNSRLRPNGRLEIDSNCVIEPSGDIYCRNIYSCNPVQTSSYVPVGSNITLGQLFMSNSGAITMRGSNLLDINGFLYRGAVGSETVITPGGSIITGGSTSNIVMTTAGAITSKNLISTSNLRWTYPGAGEGYQQYTSNSGFQMYGDGVQLARFGKANSQILNSDYISLQCGVIATQGSYYFQNTVYAQFYAGLPSLNSYLRIDSNKIYFGSPQIDTNALFNGTTITAAGGQIVLSNNSQVILGGTSSNMYFGSAGNLWSKGVFTLCNLTCSNIFKNSVALINKYQLSNTVSYAPLTSYNTFSNWSTSNIRDNSNLMVSLSNYTMTLSNTATTTVSYSNVQAQSANVAGITMGALGMGFGAAGLLFNQNGQLVSALTGAAGAAGNALKLNPTGFSKMKDGLQIGDFEADLFDAATEASAISSRLAQFITAKLQSLQVGPATLTLSNNQIIWTNVTVSNMVMGSNLLSVKNAQPYILEQTIGLGSNLNDQREIFSVNHINTNTSRLKFLGVRTSTGNTWAQSETRIQHVIDVTPMSYVSFNPKGSQDLAIGHNITDNVMFLSGGDVKIRGGISTSNNSIINNAVIGSTSHGAGWAGFSHCNIYAGGTYALLHSDTGDTLLNCATGKSMGFRINNIQQGYWDASGLTLNTSQHIGTGADSLHIHTLKSFDPLYNYHSTLIGQSVTYNSTNSNFTLKTDGFNSAVAAQIMGFGIMRWATGIYAGAADCNMSYVDFNTNCTRMLLDQNGNLGLGTTAPNYKLDVNGISRSMTYHIISALTTSSNANLNLSSASANYTLYAEGGANRANMYDGTNNIMTWYNNSVGIGTTTPAHKLDVVGNVNLSGALYSPTIIAGSITSPAITGEVSIRGNNGANFRYWDWKVGGAGLSGYNCHRLRLFDNGVEKMTIDENGRLGLGTTAPGYPLDIVGVINTSSEYRIGGVNIDTRYAMSNTLNTTYFKKTGDSTSGYVDVIENSGISANLPLKVNNGASWIAWNPRGSAGSYNSLVSSDDAYMIFKNSNNGAAPYANLVIAPWANVLTGGAIKINGAAGGQSTLQGNWSCTGNVYSTGFVESAQLLTTKYMLSNAAVLKTSGGTVTGTTTFSGFVNHTNEVAFANANVIHFGENYAWAEINSGKIGMGAFSSSNILDIVGGGSTEFQRRVKIWDILDVGQSISCASGVSVLNNEPMLIQKSYGSSDNYGLTMRPNGGVGLVTSATYAPAHFFMGMSNASSAITELWKMDNVGEVNQQSRIKCLGMGGFRQRVGIAKSGSTFASAATGWSLCSTNNDNLGFYASGDSYNEGETLSGGSNFFQINRNGDTLFGSAATDGGLMSIANGKSQTKSYAYYNSAGNIGESSGTYMYGLNVTNRISAAEFNAVSDIRKKKNIKPTETAICAKILNDINVIWYERKDDSTKKFGFDSDQLLQSFPNCVSLVPVKDDDDIPDNDMKVIDPLQIIALCVGSIKDLIAEVKLLKQKVK